MQVVLVKKEVEAQNLTQKLSSIVSELELIGS